MSELIDIATKSSKKKLEQAPAIQYKGRRDVIFVRKIASLMSLRFSESSFNISALAEAMVMDERTIHRRCLKAFGSKPNELLLGCRLAHAHDLMLSRNNITQIALVCGFGSSSQFSKCFKRYYGRTPKSVQTELLAREFN